MTDVRWMGGRETKYLEILARLSPDNSINSSRSRRNRVVVIVIRGDEANIGSALGYGGKLKDAFTRQPILLIVHNVVAEFGVDAEDESTDTFAVGAGYFDGGDTVGDGHFVQVVSGEWC